MELGHLPIAGNDHIKWEEMMENIIGRQSEMKNSISEIKSTLEGLNRVDERED